MAGSKRGPTRNGGKDFERRRSPVEARCVFKDCSTPTEAIEESAYEYTHPPILEKKPERTLLDSFRIRNDQRRLPQTQRPEELIDGSQLDRSLLKVTVKLSCFLEGLEQRSYVSEEPLSASETRDERERFGDEDRVEEVEEEVENVGEGCEEEEREEKHRGKEGRERLVLGRW